MLTAVLVAWKAVSKPIKTGLVFTRIISPKSTPATKTPTKCVHFATLGRAAGTTTCFDGPSLIPLLPFFCPCFQHSIHFPHFRPADYDFHTHLPATDMKFWTAPIHIFDYTFNEVSAVFYDRYPNSFAKHVVSEDVLERKVTEDSIYTRKLVVKKGASFLKSVPSWMSRLTSIRTVPTLEESIYDRKTETLVTYTRNVSFVDLFAMDEKSVYKRVESTPTQTSLSRDVAVYVNYPRFGGLIERVLVMTFRKSVKKTLNGIQEKLEERYGVNLDPSFATTSQQQLAAKTRGMSDRLTNNFLKSKIELEKA